MHVHDTTKLGKYEYFNIKTLKAHAHRVWKVNTVFNQ